MHIYHTLNCGLYIEQDGTAIMIDAIHAGPVSCMNPMSEELLSDLRKGEGIFGSADAILFTHLHEDHFDEALLKEYQRTEAGSGVPVYGIAYGENTLLTAKSDEHTREAVIGPFTVSFTQTLHEHEIYRDIPHCTITVRTGKETVLVAGDAAMIPSETPEIARVTGGKIDAAFMNPFQIAQERGKDFLRAVLTERVLVYHIPDRKLDLNSYGMIARTAIRSWPGDLNKPEIAARMSRVL